MVHSAQEPDGNAGKPSYCKPLYVKLIYSSLCSLRAVSHLSCYTRFFLPKEFILQEYRG